MAATTATFVPCLQKSVQVNSTKKKRKEKTRRRPRAQTSQRRGFVPQQFSVFNVVMNSKPLSLRFSVNIEYVHNVQVVVAHCVLQVCANHFEVIGVLIYYRLHAG